MIKVKRRATSMKFSVDKAIGIVYDYLSWQQKDELIDMIIQLMTDTELLKMARDIQKASEE